MLQRFFTDAVTVKNHAVSGRSSKSFIDEGRLDAILRQIQPGITFWLSPLITTKRQTIQIAIRSLGLLFKTYLRQYIEGSRAKGAHPVLITLMHRRQFLPDGTIRFSHGAYPQAILELGAQMAGAGDRSSPKKPGALLKNWGPRVPSASFFGWSSSIPTTPTAKRITLTSVSTERSNLPG